MPITATILAAVIPMLTYLLFLWKADKYDPEPVKMLGLHFLWGALGAVVIAIIGSQILSLSLSGFLDLSSLSIVEIIVIAPIVEETAKAVILFKTVKNIKFDNLTDGLVYGGAIGLGFGMTENFMYFLSNSSDVQTWITVVVIRSCFSAVMHCISTATFGAAIAIGKYSSKNKKVSTIILGFTVSILIHFLWNFSVINSNTLFFGFLFMISAIIFFILLFKHSVKEESRMIFNELQTEDDLIPEEHLSILSSSKRNSKDWMDESIRKDYIKAATRLAFRKMESKLCRDNEVELYLAEIETQKIKIKNLFTQSSAEGES